MDSLFDSLDNEPPTPGQAATPDKAATPGKAATSNEFDAPGTSAAPAREAARPRGREAGLSLFDSDAADAPQRASQPLPWERTTPAPGSSQRPSPDESSLLDLSDLVDSSRRPSAAPSVAPAPSRPRLTAATDGSSLGNPGPGGWGWFISEDCWAADAAAGVTNNQMELEAVRQLLISVPADVPLLILADSSYAISALTEWHHGWARRGWKTSGGKPVANVDLIRSILVLLEGRDVIFEHVRGHQGHELNESADSICREAAESLRSGCVPNRGPGFTTD